jgi:peptidoglycan/LPS O-acetylase OafA/YrhL
MNAALLKSGPEFRNDINGLRAWAVVFVVLYHFGVPGFSGGFVGVDVFFVISGLLMTGIVVRSLEEQRFALWDFYIARGRRIIPALLALCLIILLMGWFLLPVADYKQLGAHIATSASFVSNVKYWLESGYFDASSHDKWLLHTWSLAVEWQFYLLLPLVLMLAWKLRPQRSTLFWSCTLAFAGSILLCVFLTPAKPTAAFFLLPTRAWEMLAGGVLYFYQSHRSVQPKIAPALESSGLLLIVGCVALLSPSAEWPGWRALLPVAGSVAVLAASRRNSFWTGNFLAQWLGSRSYSIYLWHWPLVVGLGYVHLDNNPWAITAAIGLTLLASDLSFRVIETRSRQWLTKQTRRVNLFTLIGLALAICTAGALLFVQKGLPGRHNKAIDITSAEANNSNPRKSACHLFGGVSSPGCLYGTGPLGAIVFGDSHSDAVVTAVAAALPDRTTKQWTYSACPVLEGVQSLERKDDKCGDFVEWGIAQLQSVPRDVPVVIANRHGQYLFGRDTDKNSQAVPTVYFTQKYSTTVPTFVAEYQERLVETTCRIAKTHPVFLLRPIPEMGQHIPNTARDMILGNPQSAGVSVSDYLERNAAIWKAQDSASKKCGAVVIDPIPILCPGGLCSGFKEGRPLYYDDNHLSEYGNKFLTPLFEAAFKASRNSKPQLEPTSP